MRGSSSAFAERFASRTHVLLASCGDAQRAVGQAKYLKNVVRCHGIQSAGIDECLKQLLRTKPLEIPDDSEAHWTTCGHLLKSAYFEEKEVGIRLLKTRATKLEADGGLSATQLLGFSAAFDRGVKTWATCDSFCNRVVKPMLETRQRRGISAKDVLDVLSAWNVQQQSPWRQRASCVALVIPARRGWFVETGFSHAEQAVRRSDDRFVQLGAGWLMRELTTVDKKRALASLRRDHPHWSREAVRYAIEKLSAHDRQEVLQYVPPGAEPASGGLRSRQKRKRSSEG
mmetsp:Transcript_65001/g.209382  ORF Transcript_65001/g.209382 Transcript_65001/m.209382 type:complete len:286 (-) Transcript_65001:92-949(-)